MAAILKIKNHDISATVWMMFTKFGKMMQKKGLLPATTVKIYEFPKYKTVKSQRSTDFDEIWHGNKTPPKKHTLFASPCRLSHQAWKSVDGFDL